MTQFMNDKCTLIGVHVRRGDFTSAINQAEGHQAAEKDYLERAIRYFRTINAKCVKFIVLGDDYNWNVANIVAAKVFVLIHILHKYFSFSNGLGHSFSTSIR
jgi:hypothetical protein